jgi:hypothetical protein
MSTAVAEVLGPEIRTPFAQEAAQAVSMLVESLAAEWDTAVEDLLADNDALRDILTRAGEAVTACPRNDMTAGTVKEIEAALAVDREGRLSISALAAENDALRSALATLLEMAEDMREEPGFEPLTPVRAGAYRHLREVAVRGWSFFDVSGFRERIVRARSELSE